MQFPSYSTVICIINIIFDPWCYRVAQAYVNQKKLDTETKILQANASQYAKQTMQWLKLVEEFNQALKVWNPNYNIAYRKWTEKVER